MTRRELGVDGGIAALVLAVSLGVLASDGLGPSIPGTHELDALGALLAAAAAVPLVARRLAPLLVFAAATAGTLALVGLNYPIDLPVAVLVAAYGVAVAYGGDGRSARRRAAIAATGAFIPALVVAYAVGGEPIELADLTLLALMLVGVWIAGEHTRMRRMRVADLEGRARRTEREAEQERRLAAAEERTRIARELHDAAGHAINVILVQAGAARLLHERDPARSREAIGAIESVARDTISEIDRLVRALRDDDSAVPLTPADPAALEALVERHRAAGLTIVTDVRGERNALPRSVAWAAYRILQEALTNAARHGAGRAEVAVCLGPDVVEIVVTNPVAPNGSRPSGGGHGIVGMRERATLLGGTLEAGADGGSFRLYARLPQREAAP